MNLVENDVNYVDNGGREARSSAKRSYQGWRPLISGLLCAGLLLGLAGPHMAANALIDGGIDIRNYGAVGDGETGDTHAFESALEEIGGEGATIILTRGDFVVDSISIPDHVTLAFRNGGRLLVKEGGRAEINGAIDAGVTPIFSGEGAVEGAPKNLYVYPQWFGALGDGQHNDAPAIQRAADLAVGATGRTLFIPEGEYLFKDDIVIRCNVENRGLFVKDMEIDEDRTRFSYDLFLPTHYPKHNPHIRFEPDHPAQELEAERFFGVEEGSLTVPAYREVPLADGSGAVDIAEGGTLRFSSTDFFSSRRVRKGAHFYDKNDIMQMVSNRGDVFPEFAFAYDAPPEADPWSADEVYDKADYVTHRGEVFKATWASGEGSRFEHNVFGKVEIGPVEPNPGSSITTHDFVYEDGTEDDIYIWRRVGTQVWYREKDAPVTVNGLRVEVRLQGHDGETKRVNAGVVNVHRSNMVFNGLEISVRDREATMSRLMNIRGCVNVEFNNGYFSGATSAHLGYNILNSNVANIRYNDCISTNARKGLDGRHGKNVTIQGGYYNVIEDHYGRNYTIRDVTVSSLSVRVPGDSTPDADLNAWEFAPRRPFGFNGANLHIENCTVDNESGAGVLFARGDVGDLYGTVTLKNIDVRRNAGDVRVFGHSINEDFDYGHEVRTPDRLVIEDVRLENPGRLEFLIGAGFDGGAYGPVEVRNVGPIGGVYSASESVDFLDCTFEDAEFDIQDDSYVNFRGAVFSGRSQGLSKENIGRAVGNLKTKGAELSFPAEFANPSLYATGECATGECPE